MERVITAAEFKANTLWVIDQIAASGKPCEVLYRGDRFIVRLDRRRVKGRTNESRTAIAAQYDREDVGYMTDPQFWRMIEKARKEPTIPMAEVRKRFGRPAKPARRVGKRKPRVER